MTRTRAHLRFPHFILALAAVSCDDVIVSDSKEDFAYDEIRPTLTLTDEYGEVQVTQQDDGDDVLVYAGSYVSASSGERLSVEYKYDTTVETWQVEPETLGDGWELQHVYDEEGLPARDVYVQQVGDLAKGYVEDLDDGQITSFSWTHMQLIAEDAATSSRARTADGSGSSGSSTNTVTFVWSSTNCPPFDTSTLTTNTCYNVSNNSGNTVLVITVDTNTCTYTPHCYDR